MDVYSTIAVKEETKKLVEGLKEAFGARSYDETIRELARSRSFLLLKDLKGSLKGESRFVRDKNDWERDTG